MKLITFLTSSILLINFALADDQVRTKAPIEAPSIDVSLTFSYTNFPLTLKVYELNAKGRRFQSGRISVVTSRAELPLGGEVTTKPIKIKKGTDRIFALVVENNTNQDMYFYAAPHDTDPMENTLGNKFFCFCYGHVYKVPAKRVWSKIGLLTIAENSFGDRITFKHRIFGMSPEKMREHLRRQQSVSGGR